MRVWYDAGTGKHMRYGAAIAKRLRTLGHEVILTTRKHPDTLGVARTLNEKPVVVGKYATSLCGKLLESSKRQLRFCKMFEDVKPDVAISSQSVELCRVAFGLNIPIITTFDTPHAIAQNKLTIPFTSFLVVSKAIPRSTYAVFGAEKIVRFDGVDEVAWIKNFRPTKLDYEKPLIVVRQLETGAAYALGKRDITERLARKLTSLGTVVFLPRYDRYPRKDLVVPQHFVDSASLVKYADLVLSTGGTIAREAALQGTLSIVISTFRPAHVDDYLSKRGFPLFTVNPSEVLACAKQHLGKQIDASDLLAELEDPVDVINRVVEEEI